MLRRFEERDDEWLISCVADADALRCFGGPSLTWPLDTRQLARIRRDPAVTAWSAVERSTGRVLGHAEVVDRGQGRRHLARVLVDPGARGRGRGRSMLASVLEVEHGRMAQVVTLRVYADNAPARALYERLGFGYVMSEVPEVLKMSLVIGA